MKKVRLTRVDFRKIDIGWLAVLSYLILTKDTVVNIEKQIVTEEQLNLEVKPY